MGTCFNKYKKVRTPTNTADNVKCARLWRNKNDKMGHMLEGVTFTPTGYMATTDTQQGNVVLWSIKGHKLIDTNQQLWASPLIEPCGRYIHQCDHFK